MIKVLPIVMLLASCGFPGEIRTKPPLPKEDNWKVLGRAAMDLKTEDTGLNVVLGSGSATVTGTILEETNFTIDFNGVGFQLASEPTSIGNLVIGTINFNHLRICGVSNDEKCTVAQIRMYTTELASDPGISGFVNTDYGYGVPVWAGKAAADQSVGLTVSNAGVVDTYNIPVNDNKLTNSDFGGTTYQMVVDTINAGSGDYEMTLVVELVVQ
jgi:hypothetical protein